MWLLTLLVALYAPQSEHTMSTTDNITVTLAVDAAEALQFTVENKRAEPYRFCNWHTPLEGLYSDMFEVLDSDGKAASYLGIMAKRGEPAEEDYVTVAPGKSVSAKVTRAELAENYDVSRQGSYRVRFIGKPRINGLPDSNVVKIEVR